MSILYQDLSTKELHEVIDNKQNIDFDVEVNKTAMNDADTVSGVKNKPNYEWPPINHPDDWRKLILHIDQSTSTGRWQTVIFKTYINGGKIYYKLSEDERSYNIKIVFNTN